MPTISIARPLATVLTVSLLAGPLPARAEETIRCSSNNYNYRYCRVNTDNRVELVRQRSSASCRQDRSWGYDRRGVWVDRGCDADFRVGYRDYGNDHHDKHNGDKVAAGAALVGLAAIVALSASKSNAEQKDVQGWAVGTFTGYDEQERTEVQLTILPGGNVTGRAGRTEFTGSFADPKLETGRHRFRVERSGNGFIATDERDSNHRVVFQRSGSGY